MIGSIIAAGSVVAAQAAHTVTVEVANNSTMNAMPSNITTTKTNTTLYNEELYRYCEVNGTGSTLPNSEYVQVPVYQDETTRGQPYENSHSSVCEGDCEAGEWTPAFLSEDVERKFDAELRDAARANRTTAPAPTTVNEMKELDIEVDEEDKDTYNLVEEQPKNSTMTIEAARAAEQLGEEIASFHSRGTSTGMPSTTADLLKSEKQIKKEYEDEKALLTQLGAAVATSALLVCTGLFAKKTKKC